MGLAGTFDRSSKLLLPYPSFLLWSCHPTMSAMLALVDDERKPYLIRKTSNQTMYAINRSSKITARIRGLGKPVRRFCIKKTKVWPTSIYQGYI